MTWGKAFGSHFGVLLQLPDSLSSCIESLELVKDLNTEPLLMQEFLESDHCEILAAVLLARLSAEVLMKLPMRLPMKLPSQVHGAQAQAGLRSTLEVRVYLWMSVAGSDVGLVEVVHIGQPGVALEGLVGVVHVGLPGVASEELVEVLVELVPAGLPEVVFEELVEVLVELVPAGLVLVGSVEDSGLFESLLAPRSLLPFSG